MFEEKKYKLIKTTHSVNEFVTKGGEFRNFVLIKLQPQTAEFPLMTEEALIEGEDIPIKWHYDISWDLFEFMREKTGSKDYETLMKHPLIDAIIGMFLGRRDMAESIFDTWVKIKKKMAARSSRNLFQAERNKA